MATITSVTKGREVANQQVSLWQALAAFLLGLVILYDVGFVPMAAHNAAHDACHATAFPCY